MRRGFASLTLFSFIAAGCAEIGLVPNGLPPPPAPRPAMRAPIVVSSVFGASLIARRKVDGLKVEIFVIGEGKVRGSMVSELKSPEARLTPPVIAVLIRHPKEGAILFGAGLPEDMGGMGKRRLRGAALAPFTENIGKDIVSRLHVR